MAFVRLLKDLMRDKEIGHRFVPIIPDEARTFGMDAMFPTAKIYSPHGQNYEPVDRDLLLSYKEADDGPDPARGHHRGRLDGLDDRGGHVVRHARRAHDPDLHLLLDVRLPAHRRPDVAARRPDGPRLPARRHRRPHHAERRGPAARGRPLAAARLDQPGGGRLRPGVGVRDRATSSRTACAGCTARQPEDVFYYLTVYNEPYPQPAEPDDLDVRGPAQGPLPLRRGARRRRAPQGATSWPRAWRCAGRWRRSGCSPRTGAWRPTSGRRRPGRSCAATRWPCERAQPAQPRRRAARAVRDPGAVAASGAVRRRSATTCGRCRTRSPGGCRATGPRSAPTGSACPTPGRRCAATSTSTPRRSRWRCSPSWPSAARSKPEVLREAIARYHLKNGVTEAGAAPESNDTQSMGV